MPISYGSLTVEQARTIISGAGSLTVNGVTIIRIPDLEMALELYDRNANDPIANVYIDLYEHSGKVVKARLPKNSPARTVAPTPIPSVPGPVAAPVIGAPAPTVIAAPKTTKPVISAASPSVTDQWTVDDIEKLISNHGIAYYRDSPLGVNQSVYQAYLYYVSTGAISGPIPVTGDARTPTTTQPVSVPPIESPSPPVVPTQPEQPNPQNPTAGDKLKQGLIDQGIQWANDRIAAWRKKHQPVNNKVFYQFPESPWIFTTGEGRFIIPASEASAIYMAAGGSGANYWSEGIVKLSKPAEFAGIVYIKGHWYDANMFSITARGFTAWDSKYLKSWTDAIIWEKVTTANMNPTAFLPGETGVAVTNPFTGVIGTVPPIVDNGGQTGTGKDDKKSENDKTKDPVTDPYIGAGQPVGSPIPKDPLATGGTTSGGGISGSSGISPAMVAGIVIAFLLYNLEKRG